MYTKELLVNAFLHRYVIGGVTMENIEKLETMASKFFDEAGRDKFRVYAQVTPKAIKEYNAYN